uniref:Uncharacterized protein n=1 Tax=Lactuca sativa TaxID=4236 RepID=A0A9R1X9N8_LACSA|nr:hypothetical protein LSAT_V11C500294540 [Lactuca sativa]
MVAASISTTFLPLYKPIKSFVSTSQTPKFFPKTKHGADASIVWAVSKEQDMIPIQSNDFTDHQVGILVIEIVREVDGGKDVQLIGGFGGSEGRLCFEGGFSTASSSCDGNQVVEGENIDKLIDRTSNATIVLVAGTFGLKICTLTQLECIRRSFKRKPTFGKDDDTWSCIFNRQLDCTCSLCCEGKPLLEFDRTNMFKNGLVGFTLHGSFSHYYYYFCGKQYTNFIVK